MARRTIVDPRFPTRVRELRHERGLSLRDLAGAAYIGKSTLSEIENGHHAPCPETALHLDRALDAAGELAAMVTMAPEPDPEHQARVQYVVSQPMRLDRKAVDALGEVLAAHRRLDDVLDAQMLLSAADAEWRTVSQLADQARGPAVAEMRRLAATWTQYYGWLLAEARRDADAVRVLIEAGEQADAVDDGQLASQVENFRGYLERQRGNPRGIVRHFIAAYHTPGSSILQRVGDAAQAAHGFALLGDRSRAEQLLGEASDLTESADGVPAPEIAYWLSPGFTRMGIGLVWLALGDNTRAADHLRSGLESLPAGFADAEWAQEYRTALDEAVR